jgi:hypothetical protein
MPVDLTVDQRAVQRVAKALKAEADGKALRKDLIAELKTAVAPGVSSVQGKLNAIPHTTAAVSAPTMSSYLSARVKPVVRLSGQRTGIQVKIRKTPQLRGFTNAARMLNLGTWRHKVFGRDVWVQQVMPTMKGFFDDTLAHDKPIYRAAVIGAVEKMARRVASRAK